MPQFDINILNSQNINLFSFCFSYLFYIKSLYFFLLYYFKLPSKVVLIFFLYFLKEIIYINNSFSYFLKKLLSFFQKLKIITFLLSLENKFVLLL